MPTSPHRATTLDGPGHPPKCKESPICLKDLPKESAYRIRLKDLRKGFAYRICLKDLPKGFT